MATNPIKVRIRVVENKLACQLDALSRIKKSKFSRERALTYCIKIRECKEKLEFLHKCLNIIEGN